MRLCALRNMASVSPIVYYCDYFIMNIFEDYIYPLAERYRIQANPAYAESMSRYMRDQFEFFGVKHPQRRVIDKQFVKDYGLPAASDLKIVLSELWQQPEREFQYFAIELAAACKYYQQKDTITMIESMIVQRSWWDTVDAISSMLVVPYFRQFPEQVYEIVYQWISSDSIWLQRVAITFQRKYKKHTDRELLFDMIRQCAYSREFFIQKGIGWALREYAYVYPEVVRAFIDSQPMSNLSKREALKRLTTATDNT